MKRSGIYWACQAGGWGLYSAIGLWTAFLSVGWKPYIAFGYGLFYAYSIGLTHWQRHVFRSRGWLYLPTLRAVPRFLAAILLTGGLQTLLVLLTAAIQGNPFGRTAMFASWFGITSANAAWVTLYVAITASHRTQDLKLALRDAELRALEAQVNPHFLFNCLNTIRGMIVEDPNQAQEMVTRLANILRYNLQFDRVPTVPLSREVEVVSDYLALESARFEDRLRVQFAVDTEAGGIPVPTMLVQTLVENALKHGIANLREGGDVLIRASATRDVLTVEVENTGTLTTSEPLATQVGLKNARERLRLLYGDRANLQLTTSGGDRVTARMLIPRVV